MTPDGAQIKLTGTRVRPDKPELTYTICVFEWIEGHMAESDFAFAIGDNFVTPPPEWIEPHWVVRSKPISAAQAKQHEALIASGDTAFFRHGPSPRRGDRLELPGLVLRWEKVTPVLHRLAEAGETTCTLAQLRSFVQRS